MEVKEASARYVRATGYKQTEVGVIPEDWDFDYIENLAHITTGSRNTQDRVDDGQYPFFVRSQTVERINSYSFDGEAVLTAGDGVGTGKVFHYIKGKFDAHQRVYRISDFSELINGYFFYLYFSSHFYNRIMQMTAKSSVDSVRREMIARMLIPLPPTKAEQEAIAEALSDADALIESLEQLLTKKHHLKQGAMQQLLTGKKRLPGFSGEWEVKTFNEVCWFQEGPGVRNTQFTTSGVKLLNGTNIFRGALNLESTSRFISESEAYGPYSHFLAHAGDIVIASSGISIERFHEKVAFVRAHDLPFCMNTSTIRFKPHAQVLASDFLLQYLMSDSFKRAIGGQATGSAQLNFGPSHVAKVPISLPPFPEQTAIAAILSDMDAELAALEAKLAKARRLKQGMMQELLTGRIRLV